jgi:hypothetical protein
MKKIVYLLAALVFIASIAVAQNRIKINISFSTDSGKPFKALYFGADDIATEGLDTSLGELDLPDLPPPGGIHGWFRFFDLPSNSNKVSYVDLRPFPKPGENPVKYEIEIQNIVRFINFTWDPINSPLIDSIYLEDSFEELPIVRENMMANTSYTHDKWISDIDKFYIKVWYKSGESSVVEDGSDISYCSFLSDNSLLIAENISIASLYNITGEEINKFNFSSNSRIIDLGMLPKGIYFIILTDELSGNHLNKILKY